MGPQFLHEQGIDIESNVFQDNQSCILMCKKGREILSKRTRAMNVRYFAVKDSIDKGFFESNEFGHPADAGQFFHQTASGIQL